MADYSRHCSECAEEISFGSRHRPWCTRAPQHLQDAYWRHKAEFKDGFDWNETLSAWRCLRGCGCFVWSLESHKKNVCPEWVPSEQ